MATTTTTVQETTSNSGARTRVAIATIVGTTIEWYDFFIYANAAALVFASLFFQPAGESYAQLWSFFTVGVSFLFRPIGAILAGHFGDIIGRRAMLVVTLILMGAATTLIGVLPTYAQVGLLAPILLVVLRLLQGLSTGGEWGGAALMAVETASRGRRGMFGAFPQIGVPLGMLLASGVLALMTGVIAPGKAFLEWGWRIPFLLSIVLVVVGIFVRRSVEESPVFVELRQRKVQTKAPVSKLLRKHSLLVIMAALTFAGVNAAGYLTTGGFLQSYATKPLTQGGAVGMETTAVLLAVTGGSFCWLIFTFLAGMLSDRIGRKNTYIAGWIVLLPATFLVFQLVQTANPGLLFIGLCVFSIGLGLTYGPVSAFFSELFPASIRYSGASIAYAFGSILGGAFVPLIGTALVSATGTVWSVAWYLLGVIGLSFTATLLLRDRKDIPLAPQYEHLQETGHFVWQPPTKY